MPARTPVATAARPLGKVEQHRGVVDGERRHPDGEQLGGGEHPLGESRQRPAGRSGRSRAAGAAGDRGAGQQRGRDEQRADAQHGEHPDGHARRGQPGRGDRTGVGETGQRGHVGPAAHHQDEGGEDDDRDGGEDDDPTADHVGPAGAVGRRRRSRSAVDGRRDDRRPVDGRRRGGGHADATRLAYTTVLST